MSVYPPRQGHVDLHHCVVCAAQFWSIFRREKEIHAPQRPEMMIIASKDTVIPRQLHHPRLGRLV